MSHPSTPVEFEEFVGDATQDTRSLGSEVGVTLSVVGRTDDRPTSCRKETYTAGLNEVRQNAWVHLPLNSLFSAW